VPQTGKRNFKLDTFNFAEDYKTHKHVSAVTSR